MELEKIASEVELICWWIYCVVACVSAVTCMRVVFKTDEDLIGQLDHININRIRKVGFFILSATLFGSSLSSNWIAKALSSLITGAIVLHINDVALSRRRGKKLPSQFAGGKVKASP